MNSARQCARLGHCALRRFSTNRSALMSNVDPESTSTYKNLKKNQELFQKEDLVEEVYIKGGARDTIVFKLIVGLTFVGLVVDGNTIWTLIHM